MPKINVVLVGTENSGNLGAIARLCMNFEVQHLILVNPQCEINDEAYARSTHGRSYLENAITLPILEDARKYNDFLLGFSAREGLDYNVLRTPLDLEDAIKATLPLKGTLGLVFGRESRGLTNEELKLLDFMATIPINSSYPVLNLSHAVAISLYEFKKIMDGTRTKPYREASGHELIQVYLEWDEIVDQLPFPLAKRYTMKRVLRNALGRSIISGRETHTLIGALRVIRLLLEGNYPPTSKKNQEPSTSPSSSPNR